jgi:hypothetical protein
VRSLLFSSGSPVESLWSKKQPQQGHTLSTSAGQDSQQVQIILTGAPLALAQAADALAGMDDSRVIATAESIAYLRQAVIGKFARKGHRNLARAGN